MTVGCAIRDNQRATEAIRQKSQKVRKSWREIYGSLVEVRTRGLSKSGKRESGQRDSGSASASIRVLEEKRQGLTFTEAKIGSGNRAERRENENHPGALWYLSTSASDSLECRCVQPFKTLKGFQAEKGSSEESEGPAYRWRGSLPKTSLSVY